MSKMGEVLRQERERRGLNRHQLAALIGYANLNKGARRITAVEQHGGDEGGVRAKMVEVLGMEQIAPDAVAADIATQTDAFARWVNMPVLPRMVVRWLPAFYMRHDIPEEFHGSDEKMERYACGFAAETNKKVCLMLSRRLSLWIDESGKVYSRSQSTRENPVNSPTMFIKGRSLAGSGGI